MVEGLGHVALHVEHRHHLVPRQDGHAHPRPGRGHPGVVGGLLGGVVHQHRPLLAEGAAGHPLGQRAARPTFGAGIPAPRRPPLPHPPPPSPPPHPHPPPIRPPPTPPRPR